MISHGISDHDVLSFCSKENSILITQDSDFGTIIFFGTSKHNQSIIYLKYTTFADRLIVKDFVIDLLKSINQ
jgi:predicted nuclease of predicted toxin-antitoxin system